MKFRLIFLFFIGGSTIPALGMQRPIFARLAEGAKKLVSRAPAFTYIAEAVEKSALSPLFPVSGPQGALTRGFLENVFQKITLTPQGRTSLIVEFNSIAEREYVDFARRVSWFKNSEPCERSMEALKNFNVREQRELHKAIEHALCEAGYIRPRVQVVVDSFEECKRLLPLQKNLQAVACSLSQEQSSSAIAHSAQTAIESGKKILQFSKTDPVSIPGLINGVPVVEESCAYFVDQGAVESFCNKSSQTDSTVFKEQATQSLQTQESANKSTQKGRKMVDVSTQPIGRYKDSGTQTEKTSKHKGVQAGRKVRSNSTQVELSAVSCATQTALSKKADAKWSTRFYVWANIFLAIPVCYLALQDMRPAYCAGKEECAIIRTM